MVSQVGYTQAHLYALVFYFFSALTIASSFRAITAQNMVHAVIFLIFSFISAAGLFVLMGAEFLAFMLIIVYVGAVAVLFLFVVMMLDTRSRSTIKTKFKGYEALIFFLTTLFFVELLIVVDEWKQIKSVARFSPIHQNFSSLHLSQKALHILSQPHGLWLHNTFIIGALLYTKYSLSFCLTAIVLLVSMIGAIVLTMHPKDQQNQNDVKRQNINHQILTQDKKIVKLANIKPGACAENLSKKLN